MASTLLLQFTITIVLFYCQFISIDGGKVTNNSLRPLSRHVREVKNSFKLERFVSIQHYEPAYDCLEKKLNDTYLYEIPSALHHDFIPDSKYNKENQCPEYDSWLINWDKDDFGRKEYETECWPSEDNYPRIEDCKSLCTCLGATSRGDVTAVKHFSLLPEASDVESNKIVTGARFLLQNHAIYLQIQQATLLPNGKVDNDKMWKNVTNLIETFLWDDGSPYYFMNDTLEEDKDYVMFDYDTRTINLDDIFVPKEYVITGVKFASLEDSDPRRGVRLMVKGTKFDISNNLIGCTDKWFDYTNSSHKSESYNSPRREIKLENSEASELATYNTPITDTNRYVRFRATKDYKTNPLSPAIPYFSADSVESQYNTPIRGIGLSYEGSEGFGGYVTVKVMH